ncbi:unnamed protein product [Urochloa humidicola]
MAGAFEVVHDLDDEEYDSDGHIDDGLIEEIKEKTSDEMFSKPSNLRSKYYKGYFRCPYLPSPSV